MLNFSTDVTRLGASEHVRETAAPPDSNSTERCDGILLAQLEAYCKARVCGSFPTAAEQDSWDQFFRYYSTATRRIAEKAGLRGVDVEDCLQEAWTEVFLQLAAGGFNPQRGRLYCWIFPW